jgi:hypothetical protein
MPAMKLARTGIEPYGRFGFATVALRAQVVLGATGIAVRLKEGERKMAQKVAFLSHSS